MKTASHTSCAVILAMSAACAGPPAPSASSDFEKAVDALAAGILADGQVPSLSIAVARGQQTVLEKTYGRSDIENDVTAGNDTVYRIASITKQFTAAAILRLVEQGRVDLDADVLKYLPEFHSQRRAITVRQLLNHTSGIQSLTEVPKYVPKERLDLTDAEIVDTFQDEPPHFRPGENFLYNNSGFYLLGMILERVTGQRYADHLKQSIFDPLGLKSTSVCDEVSVVRHRAHGYVFNDGQPPQNAPFISSSGPKGGGNLCSTAHDLVLWARALREGRVVSPQSYALMTTPGALSDGRPVGYGLGVFLSEMEGRPEVFHGGDFISFTAFLAWYPADDVTVAVLQNSNVAPAFTGHLARQIARRVLEVPEPPFSEVPPDNNELTRVSGAYRIGHASIDVRPRGSDLIFASDRVWQLAGHTFRYFGGGAFKSIRNPALQAQFLPGEPAPAFSLTLNGRAIGNATRHSKSVAPAVSSSRIGGGFSRVRAALNWISADQIAQAHREVGKELGVDVAPVGIAWQRVIKERPDVNLFDADLEHPNMQGTYLSTLVVYATVFRKDPSALSYAPQGVTPEVATYLKKVAWETVQEFSR